MLRKAEQRLEAEMEPSQTSAHVPHMQMGSQRRPVLFRLHSMAGLFPGRCMEWQVDSKEDARVCSSAAGFQLPVPCDLNQSLNAPDLRWHFRAGAKPRHPEAGSDWWSLVFPKLCPSKSLQHHSPCPFPLASRFWALQQLSDTGGNSRGLETTECSHTLLPTTTKS